ncbi:MAG: 3-phosphoshikimate 1-carboxyvinyltransferase [Actinomycetota bacterium]
MRESDSPAQAPAADPAAWPAPYAMSPVSGCVAVPGSKSMTNRALLLAAISDGPSRVTGALLARDTELMISALRALGAQVKVSGSTVDVTPMTVGAVRQLNTGGAGASPASIDIDCGLAGTVMRFVPAIAGLAVGRISFDGDAAARSRPMRELIAALGELGLTIDSADGGLPMTVEATGSIRGGTVQIDSSASSQFISALLLAGATYGDGIVVTATGERVPSAPHIEMTMAMLADHGVHVSTVRDATGQTTWQIEPQLLRAFDRHIEPDLSNALPFLAAAAVTGGKVSVNEWPQTSTQPGDHIRPLLSAMGCDVAWQPTTANTGTLTVSGPARLKAIDVDMGDLGELTPTVAAMCLFAEGESRLRNIGHIRGHETDRIAALEAIAALISGRCIGDSDDLVITGLTAEALADQTAVTLPSFDDHRLATAGAIIGLRRRGVSVENIGTTAKTLPDFTSLWSGLVQP